MFKKIFHQKRKRQDPGRHNTNKITMDPVSTAILSRHFSPLSSRAKSPSDLLDIVGYPFTSNQFTRSSPELILYSTPLQLTETNNNNNHSHDNVEQEEEEVQHRDENRRQRLTIRNNSTPSPITNHDILLLETSREDKTLVEEEEKRKEQAELLLADETKREMYRLQQKLLDFEHEREVWKQKLQGYIQREEQMRQIIHENQLQLNQYKNMYTPPSRHNSYRTVSTHSSSWPEEEEDEDEEEAEEPYIYYNPRYYHNYGNLKRRYSSYYTNTTNNYRHHSQPYYYYE